MSATAFNPTPSRPLTQDEQRQILQFCGYADDVIDRIPDYTTYQSQLKQTLGTYVCLGSESNVLSTKLRIMASLISIHRQPDLMLINAQLFDIYVKELCAWFSIPFGLLGESPYDCLKPTNNPKTLIAKDVSAMSKPEVQFKRLPNCIAEIQLPAYMTPGSVGFDLQSTETVCLAPGERAVVRTGLSVQIPDGYEMQIRPRSGLAAKHGITVVNAPGTVDCDYRGELMMILLNTDQQHTFVVQAGDRIAQAVIAPFVQAQLSFVEELTTTERGEDGFGSTGV